MLHDKYLSQFHFSEKHGIEIHRPPDFIYDMISEFDFGDSFIIRTLFSLRGLTGKMTARQGLLRENFIDLETIPNRELILGLAGQFWKSDGNLQKLTPHEFREFDQPGFLKATWNFEITRRSGSLSLLETETRIQCLGDRARRRFSMYWFFIRPFSGLIRKEMLKSIKRKAEAKPFSGYSAN